ncbi:HNH endonuclease [Candidatus Shapirobacteria bacterium]|nr:HNH endonuclease [Candidatus Shapirobacteria bacterium]
MGKRNLRSTCRNCKKDFLHHSSSHGFYCSLKCQQEFQTSIEIKRWLGGEINPINTNGLLRPWARRYIFKLNNNHCSVCGWDKLNEFTNLIPLEIDHIDGDYRNNLLSNIRLLCPNCHSLTNTYKNSNKGHGRKHGTALK